MDFLNFLIDSQRNIDWPYGPEFLYVVLSHEVCDLDSCASTLAIAYYHHRNRGPTGHIFMPVLNMLRRDYPTKSEVRFVFSKHGIEPETHLVFRDDVPEVVMLRARFILVNHHVSPFHYNVEKVYDYRPLQLEAARLPIYCQRIMHPTVSCAALIAERYTNANLNFSGVRCPIVFEMLHSAILLQNCNFVQSEEQAQSLRDYQMLSVLEQNLDPKMEEQRDSLYNSLVYAVFNMNHLTLPQVLRRQFKLLRATNGLRLIRVGQCCFPMAVSRFISYENANVAIQQFANEHGCDYLLILGTSIRYGGGLGVKEMGLIPVDGLRDVETRRLFDHIIINLNAAHNPLLCMEAHRDLDFMQGAFYFLNTWKITFYDILQLMQRILYDWLSEDVRG
ncbi:exopolyphosphatase PRUNE1-like isoform X2 [Scaptodrosophila lebanonensis]|uniref:Exopolyphosphatase PRUNE1-like isoform X2 n=1 Tax=Drosophila lebanonensis TaxID=7225 RepID=A0A6J2U0U0_DROLE|nr:exopolyphosphatase PRUNE1-like isoform X2 [Scaptodrosophila lebanonensis]